MKIANIMFGRGLGGIEQAFLDYNEALLLAGHEVLAVSHPLGAINPEISGNLTHETLSNRGSWDVLTASRMRRLYRRWQPDVLISHGNRAISLNLLALGTGLQPSKARREAGGMGAVSPSANTIHLGVTHNYNLRRFSRLDGVIAITEKLRAAAMEAGVSADRIHLLPNMVRVPQQVSTPSHTPPVIGAMGRLIEKKGFHLLLEASSLLIKRGVAFHLLIGGTGAMESRLRQQCQQLGLQSSVTFLGWVGDKSAFFENIDVFCLPSLHEPFGIVLLEAMAYGRPVVGFRSEGPGEIIKHGEALLVENGDVPALAEALAQQLQYPSSGQKERDFVAQHYALPVVSHQLDAILQSLKQEASVTMSVI